MGLICKMNMKKNRINYARLIIVNPQKTNSVVCNTFYAKELLNQLEDSRSLTKLHVKRPKSHSLVYEWWEK